MSAARSETLHPFEVAREDIDLEIDLIAVIQLAKRRDLGGVWDDVQQKVANTVSMIAHIVDGKRDAFDRDRQMVRPVS